MLRINWHRIAGGLLACLMVVLLALGLVSCSKNSVAVLSGDDQKPVEEQLPRAKLHRRISQGAQISEVSPPQAIQELRQILEGQPQVEIISPHPDEVLQDNTVLVRLKVEDLTLFKDATLGLGPHLQVFLDNQLSQAVYDLNQPLTLQDLTPGTHTLRVFAAYPWDESFKNEGAYAQITFHVFTKTQENNPNSTLPLLTYNRPQGDYGAEPIMLDFYLINAPLHLVAQERPDDDVVDWQIRCTINGESFILDRWQPIYLEGFKPGKNWVQLEFLDEKGNLVQNAFNNPISLVTYKPDGRDTLSQLVKGELKAADARGIVDPNYAAKTLVPTPSPSPTPSSEPSLISPSPGTGVPSYTPIPSLELSPTPTPLVPSPTPRVVETPPVELPKDEQTAPKAAELTTPAGQKQATEPTETGPAEAKQPQSRFRTFFDRFRRSSSSSGPSGTPSPSLPPTLPEVVVPPSPDGEATPSRSGTPSLPELPPRGENLPPEPSEEATPYGKTLPTPTEELSPSPLGSVTTSGQTSPTSTETLGDRQQSQRTQELQPSVTIPEQSASGD